MGDPATDLYFPPEALAEGTISFSTRQQEALLSQERARPSWPSRRASAGTLRDLGLIGVGTAIGLGIELLRNGFRRVVRAIPSPI